MAVTDQQALHLINRITGDEFCEDLDLTDFSTPLTGDLKIAHEKLSLIYRIAHSMDQSGTCYRNHESWREEAEDEFNKLAGEEGFAPTRLPVLETGADSNTASPL